MAFTFWFVCSFAVALGYYMLLSWSYARENRGSARSNTWKQLYVRWLMLAGALAIIPLGLIVAAPTLGFVLGVLIAVILLDTVRKRRADKLDAMRT